MTRVLVTGAGGQDARYLMPLLVGRGYEVFGMVRMGDPSRYDYLSDIPFLNLVQGDLLDYSCLNSIFATLRPDIVINTAGVTSPAACWGTPELAFHTNGIGAARLPEICARTDVKYIQFGSIAEFGPYGASKMFAQMMMDDFRERGFPTTTIRFAGHHSPFRSPIFFSRRVVQAVAKIKAGTQDSLALGDLSRTQDWGAADEFMDAVIEILDYAPGTFTVATDDPYTLEEFVEACFESVDLDWRDYVQADEFSAQPVDVPALTSGWSAELEWEPKRTMHQLAEWLVAEEMKG